MGSLLTTLLNSAQALKTYDRQIATVQNNVANASTPGYVKQTQTVEAMSFNLDVGLPGGVLAGPVMSARNEYAEESVRRQQSLLGEANQKATDLAQLEPLFSLTSSYSVSTTMSNFFKSFSQLSVNPNDSVARQSVIDSAKSLASSFNQTAMGIASAGSAADSQITTTVKEINRIAGQIRDINQTRREDYQSKNDAGLDAQSHAALEDLSQYASFSTITQPDGTVSLYLAGQSPLVIGTNQYAIQADFSTPVTRVLDSSGSPIPARLTGGKLSALLEEKNQTMPSYLSDLNTLASTLADRVNGTLGTGVDTSGATPSTPMFTYDPVAGAAGSIAVTGIQPGEIAAAYPGASGGNGNALDMAGMVDQKVINGFTFTQYFGNLGGRVGTDLSNAQEQDQTQHSMVAQAHSLRDQVSAVDINEEAAQILQIQRAYQAMGKMLSVISDLTETVIGLIR